MAINQISAYSPNPCDELPRAGGWSGFTASVLRMVQLWLNRRAIRNLSTYDDRMLQDIGLHRADVSAALEGSFWSDPSERLAQTVSARRRKLRWPSNLLGR